ncbi:MAG: ATP-binding protein [Thaumarchaeota archaeon]|nr:ATP-binding protein [Nitrososphaerota archaeon]
MSGSGDSENRITAFRRLVVFCGIPGSGKTTIASILASKLPRACHIQTDVVRSTIPHPKFTGPESRFVYGASVGLARAALVAGYDVILDGTFQKEAFRRGAIAKLSRFSSFRLVVWVATDPGVALERNAQRPSTVPRMTLFRILQSFEEPQRGLRIDSTSTPPEVAADLILANLEWHRSRSADRLH